MGNFAAHKAGICFCPQHELSASTEPGGVTSVTLNSIGAQTAGDQRRCLLNGGGLDAVAAGSATVRIGGRLAVPCFKKVTSHGGTIALGCHSVTIGGPLIVGPFTRFAKVCPAMAAGRENKYLVADRELNKVNKHTNYKTENPGSQTWNNCGPECARMLVNEIKKKEVTEWEMLKWSLDNGHASWKGAGNTQVQGKIDKSDERWEEHIKSENDAPGFSTPSDWKAMTEKHELETEEFGPNPGDQRVDDCLAASLWDGKPVMYSVDMSYLPPPPGSDPVNGPHVVLVIGCELDENGKPAAFYVNDPVRGCAIRVDAAQLVAKKRAAAFVRPTSPAW